MKMPTRITVATLLSALVVVIGIGSVVISADRPLSALEASLLNVFLWIGSVALGWMINSIYSERTYRDALLERAKPAIRRVWELQRSAEHLQLMLETRIAASRDEVSHHAHPQSSPEAVALSMQLGQLKAAVQDWRELLPEEQVESVIRRAETEERPNALRWPQFHDLVNGIAEQVDRSDPHGGFRPDILLGIYPEGGMIAYLLWLALGRRCKVVLMPDDAHAAADDDCMALLESAIKHHMRGAGRCRILLVDASIKSGATMTATIEATKQACENVGVEAIVKSACVIDFPIGGSRTITPDYVGLTGPYHLPFADA